MGDEEKAEEEAQVELGAALATWMKERCPDNALRCVMVAVRYAGIVAACSATDMDGLMGRLSLLVEVMTQQACSTLDRKGHLDG